MSSKDQRPRHAWKKDYKAEINIQNNPTVEIQGYESTEIKGKDDWKMCVVLCFSYNILYSYMWHDHKMNHDLLFLTCSVRL